MTNVDVPKSRKGKKKKSSKAKSPIETSHGALVESTDGLTQTSNAHSDENESRDSSRPVTRGNLNEEISASSIPENATAQEIDGLHISDTTARMNGAVESQSELLPSSVDSDTHKTEVEHDKLVALESYIETQRVRHDEEKASLRLELDSTKLEKEKSDTQYQNLLSKVNTIRTQLGDRLKADAEDLLQARGRIEDLEERVDSLKEELVSRNKEVFALKEDADRKDRDLSALRNKIALSQQNVLEERAQGLSKEKLAKEEFESAKQAMQDWEILAMEERSIRENLGERLRELEDQVVSYRDSSDSSAAQERRNVSIIEGLQKALEELQDTRQRELRETVESYQTQVISIQERLQARESEANRALARLEQAEKELTRLLPFEKELRERNSQLGKLRHEAVILNEHLTKALRALKKGKPENNVDRDLITNHFVHFLALDRADPKKFQVLQVISNLLCWNEEQQEKAGLARPGASNPNLKAPMSPWHRTSSTTSLGTATFDNGASGKESLADLWSEFLDKEAEKSGNSRPSVSTTSER